MEKLKDLLNEYSKKNQEYSWEIEWNDIIAYSHFWEWYETIRVSESIIISKWYEFVKWLVENDKIDEIKFEDEYTDKQTLKDVYIAWAKGDELLLMILSIQDEPIQFLISILE